MISGWLPELFEKLDSALIRFIAVVMFLVLFSVLFGLGNWQLTTNVGNKEGIASLNASVSSISTQIVGIETRLMSSITGLSMALNSAEKEQTKEVSKLWNELERVKDHCSCREKALPGSALYSPQNETFFILDGGGDRG